MRSWILIGLILAACSTSTIPDGAPTAQIVQPNATVTHTRPIIQPTNEVVFNTPNTTYQYHPSTQFLERVTDGAMTFVSQTISAQQVVANQDHTKLAIRTMDDTTMILDITTAQSIGPFDACDSMTWAGDTTTLWCMRFGHVYTIDGISQIDQLSLAATGDVYWAELTKHPPTQAYWMQVIGNIESKLCQFNPTTRTLENACLTVGQMPRWSPDGQMVASIVHQRLQITQHDGTQLISVGIGDMQVVQLVWVNTAQLAINTPRRSYRYQINDARISLQASDIIVVGR
ncbi:MAG: hypothetical protein ACO3F2_00360 [Roseiflexaceae bacterium]